MLKKYDTHLVGFAIVIIIAYWQVALMRHTLLWDSLNASFPFRFYAVECIRSGHLPLWLPFQSTGYPFYADPQSGCWYPFTWIFSLFGRYTLVSLNIEYIFCICVGGYGMYSLVSAWVKDKSAALFSALCYSCCGVFVGNAEHLTWIVSAAWLPWLFWAYFKMIVQLQIKYAAMMALLVYLIATGGYPAFLIISFYLLILIFIVLIVSPTFRKSWRRLIFLHLILLVLSVGCCLIVFYSFAVGMQASTRGNGVSLALANLYPFSPICFSSFLLPFASFKNPELFKVDISMSNGYFGLLGLIFFVLRLVQKPDKSYWLILTLSLLCMMAAVGDILPVRGFLFNWVPFMNEFRFPSVFRLFFIVGFLLLGAFSFRKLTTDFMRWKKPLVVIINCLIFICGFVLFYSLQFTRISNINWHNLIFKRHNFDGDSSFFQHVIIQSIIQLILLFVLLIAIYFRMKRKFDVKIVLLICSLDLILAVQLNVYGTIVFPDFLKDTKNNISNCPKGFPVPDNSPVGNYYDSKYWDILSPIAGNTLVIEKKLGIDGYNPFTLVQFDKFKNSGIRDSVLKNPTAYFANSVVLNDSLKYRNDALLDDTDFRKIDVHFFPGAAGDSVYFSSFGPDQFALNTRASGSRLLVLLQNNVDNWRVKIDGNDGKWYRTNIAYMGVLVPGGIHKIDFIFTIPDLFLMCLVLTGIFLLVCLFVIFYFTSVTEKIR